MAPQFAAEVRAKKIRNPKHETRNKSEIQKRKHETKRSLSVSCFEFWSFEFVSDFVLRISDFSATIPRPFRCRPRGIPIE
jgi:hypothetical protein